MTDKDADAFGTWLSARREQWLRLSLLTQSRKQDLGLAEAREVLAGYRGVARDLSLARRALPNSTLHRSLEALYNDTHQALTHQRSRPLQELWRLFAHQVPTATRALAGEIAFTTGLFVLTTIAGFFLVYAFPETGQWFLSEQMLRQVQNRTLWTDGLLNVMPSSLLAFDITQNNITVALTVFALGLLYGLGTLYIIILNGLMLGAVFGYTVPFAMALPLFRFIVAHGLVELTVICLSAAAGLALGRALARPGIDGRIASLRRSATQAGALAAVCVPFLIGCGVIEGYISPNPEFSLNFRISVGVVWIALLLAVLDGRSLQALERWRQTPRRSRSAR